MQVLPSKTGVLINIVANINDCVRAGLDIKNDKTHLRAEQLCTFLALVRDMHFKLATMKIRAYPEKCHLSHQMKISFSLTLRK